MLDFLASENCRGCRNEQCRLFKDCGVRPCHQEKGVDFCYQCDAFPCNRTNYDDRLYKIWVRINEKIKKNGLEHYYEETKRFDLPSPPWEGIEGWGNLEFSCFAGAPRDVAVHTNLIRATRPPDPPRVFSVAISPFIG